MSHERRRIHVLVVRKLRSIWVLLSIGIGDSLIQSAPHSNVIGQIR